MLYIYILNKIKQKQKRSTSFPMGIPLPRPAVRPMTLATNALSVRYSFNTTPLRMVLSSGIPEPEGQIKDLKREGARSLKLIYKNTNRILHSVDPVTVIIKDEKRLPCILQSDVGHMKKLLKQSWHGEVRESRRKRDHDDHILERGLEDLMYCGWLRWIEDNIQTMTEYNLIARKR